MICSAEEVSPHLSGFQEIITQNKRPSWLTETSLSKYFVLVLFSPPFTACHILYDVVVTHNDSKESSRHLIVRLRDFQSALRKTKKKKSAFYFSFQNVFSLEENKKGFKSSIISWIFACHYFFR